MKKMTDPILDLLGSSASYLSETENTWYLTV